MALMPARLSGKLAAGPTLPLSIIVRAEGAAAYDEGETEGACLSSCSIRRSNCWTKLAVALVSSNWVGRPSTCFQMQRCVVRPLRAQLPQTGRSPSHLILCRRQFSHASKVFRRLEVDTLAIECVCCLVAQLLVDPGIDVTRHVCSTRCGCGKGRVKTGSWGTELSRNSLS